MKHKILGAAGAICIIALVCAGLFLPVRTQVQEIPYSVREDDKTILCEDLNDQVLSYLNVILQTEEPHLAYQPGTLLCVKSKSLVGWNQQTDYLLPIVTVDAVDSSAYGEYPWHTGVNVVGCTLKEDVFELYDGNELLKNVQATLSVDGNVKFSTFSFYEGDEDITVSDKEATLSSQYYKDLIVVADVEQQDVPAGSPVQVAASWSFGVQTRSKVIAFEEQSVTYRYSCKY